ncbi:MAG TPA: isoprenoid biosynthesis glyoxalase ElbB [Longimicrobiales bacterium]|nr:isoprenoid biosynthesis glyoxalase ElbB [Longimicrobiales bacterium]
MKGERTIGVILSGSGFLDGAEIQESVLTLLALDESGVRVRVFAPDTELDEIDHVTRQPTGRKRNVLVEAARIARSRIENVANVRGTDVDGWVLPGGYGAAKNLSDFAVKGADATAHPEVARVIREALDGNVPVGAICIAPAVLAAATKDEGPRLQLTIGDDAATADALRAMGARHVDAPVTDAVVDPEHRVVTAPAYMYDDARISDVNKGIRKVVQQVVAWASES